MSSDRDKKPAASSAVSSTRVTDGVLPPKDIIFLSSAERAVINTALADHQLHPGPWVREGMNLMSSLGKSGRARLVMLESANGSDVVLLIAGRNLLPRILAELDYYKELCATLTTEGRSQPKPPATPTTMPPGSTSPPAKTES